MNDETKDVSCKALFIGAVAFTGYEIIQLSMSQKQLQSECIKAREFYINASDNLLISLDHLLAEQIA